ncbi:unnamed protein product [Schistosoma curassoni]|nr:unnamed protein product [Schistosoma curassoni]
MKYNGNNSLCLFKQYDDIQWSVDEKEEISETNEIINNDFLSQTENTTQHDDDINKPNDYMNEIFTDIPDDLAWQSTSPCSSESIDSFSCSRNDLRNYIKDNLLSNQKSFTSNKSLECMNIDNSMSTMNILSISNHFENTLDPSLFYPIDYTMTHNYCLNEYDNHHRNDEELFNNIKEQTKITSNDLNEDESQLESTDIAWMDTLDVSNLRMDDVVQIFSTVNSLKSTSEEINKFDYSVSSPSSSSSSTTSSSTPSSSSSSSLSSPSLSSTPSSSSSSSSSPPPSSSSSTPSSSSSSSLSSPSSSLFQHNYNRNNKRLQLNQNSIFNNNEIISNEEEHVEHKLPYNNEKNNDEYNSDSTLTCSEAEYYNNLIRQKRLRKYRTNKRKFKHRSLISNDQDGSYSPSSSSSSSNDDDDDDDEEEEEEGEEVEKEKKKEYEKIVNNQCKKFTYHSITTNLHHRKKPPSSEHYIQSPNEINEYESWWPNPITRRMHKDFRSTLWLSNELSDSNDKEIQQQSTTSMNKIKSRKHRKFAHSHSHSHNNHDRCKNKQMELWQFILYSLEISKDSAFQWVNKSTGLFRIVNTQLAAKEWGYYRNNKLMDYEKMARAIRFYYKDSILRKSRQQLHFQFAMPYVKWAEKFYENKKMLF